MAKSIAIQLEIPGDLSMFDMPKALHDRLQELLDRQDRDGKLKLREKREATALVELAETLSLLRVRTKQVRRGLGA